MTRGEKRTRAAGLCQLVVQGRDLSVDLENTDVLS